MTGPTLYDDVGALPMCQKLAASTGWEQEHAVTRLELFGLSGAVVGMALLGLGCLQMFPDDGHDFVNLSLHVLDVFNDRPVGQRLVLPDLSYNI